ncbi:ubiquitin-protein ligase RMD5 [Sugiyamaella lignohabitans]|uniref:GID complex catalytic subunit 2 n=1 Tax=Sugiyamaella lignohabitans TaxID=796027 RepID=A0A161HMY3_9ASCO|nr:ubiquitin-protein ligase RMD5 [Sugiyamaella lignohabitans]ANB15367.1 ubiquitin-protein ligase RMD5 [Sugiyamaella lignohabitans]
MYLTRSGEFDVASTFMKETGVSVPEHLLGEFCKMYDILQHIQARDLAPAIEWATLKRSDLLARGSNLEFSLHRLQYIDYLIEQNDSVKAINYARRHLSAFKDRYFKETSQLMSALLYVGTIDKSPYASVVKFPTYEQLNMMFASEFCSLLGFPPQSPLYLAVTAGSIAIPTLSKMESVMKRRGAEWTTTQELPVTIDLPEILQFHSIFVCPVSKEQTTETNPPMMLPCGHILANDSVRSLGKESPTHMFKCPYCPVDTNYSQAKRVYF